LFMDNRNSTQYVNPAIPTGVDDNDPVLPASFELAQNYPNPFNPTTTIGFSVATRRHVSLDVFNVLGQEVATLVNEERAPGHYAVTWDGSTMATGVYFYRLRAGEYTATRKMVLVK
jgi:hypothetical protein